MDYEANDSRMLAELFRRICDGNRQKSNVIRRAEYLMAAASELPVRINPDELIVGSDIYEIPFAGEYEMYSNGGHYSADYNRPLVHGVKGLKAKVSTLEPANQVMEDNKCAYEMVLDAFAVLINRYADEAARLAVSAQDLIRKSELQAIRDNCRHIASEPPVSFVQALQLILFTQIFLHLEGLGANSMSFGRLDQFLYPFYRKDLDAGLITDDLVSDLLICFAERISHYDVSQNLALGGVDHKGCNTENELTRIFLEAQAKAGIRQPSLSLRITSETSDDAWEAALRCVSTGIGMPSFFNDDVVIKSMLNMGAALEDARNYVLIGCYEANSQGNTFGQTTALGMQLPDLILEFMKRDAEYKSFDDFLEHFKAYFTEAYDSRYLPSFQDTRNAYMKLSASPFWGCLLHDCIETGLLPEQYGAKYNWFGLMILGIGTLIDSLYVIKKLVYDEKQIDLKYMQEQIEQNFPDDDILLLCRNMDGKFGTDSLETNQLANTLTTFIGELIHSRPLENDVRISPSLFRWMADIYTTDYPATPDGRRKGERLSYGATPTELARDISPTSMLSSISHLRTDLFANGSPVTLTYSPDELRTQKGRMLVRQLIETYFKLGGFHIQFNIQDAELLKDAQDNPDHHKNLLIRISGHSNYFVVLDEQLQNALIERTAQRR
ncbi:MAG: pyruvate formate lyase family protein [Armatimonadota bacterium]